MSKAEHFLINVTILEGRHWPLQNTDSAVNVRVGNKKRCTSICYGTDAPYFNEYFVFEFLETFENLLDYNITLTVFRPRKKCMPHKTIGYVTLDVATVWMQKDHQFYHKWAVVVPPYKEVNSKLCGFLKVDMGVIRRGEKFSIPVIDVRATDDIERNLLQSAGTAADRQKANYVFKVYRGEGLTKGKGLDLKYPKPIEKDPPNPLVEICFAGRKAKTSTKRRTTNPIWNESVVLPEYFPALCQRIKINIYHSDRCIKTLIASTCVDMRNISNDKDCGFLPTFGPGFLHFYTTTNKIEGYVGKILMSFATEIPTNVTRVYKNISLGHIAAVPESEMWRKEEIVLCAVIFNSNMIPKRHSTYPIRFEISFGHQMATSNQNAKAMNARTFPQVPSSANKIYWNVDYGPEKPCLFVKLLVPDLRHILYEQNRFTKLIGELKVKLERINNLASVQTTQNGVLENLLKDAFTFTTSTCKSFFDYLQVPKQNFVTDLKAHWNRSCQKELNEIIHTSSQTRTYDRNSIRTINELHFKLEQLLFTEETWPNVYVTMICSNKKVAFAKFPPNELIYSKTPEESGKFCGNLQSVFLQPIKADKCSCALDLLLWLDLEAQRVERFKQFLSKFELSNNFSDRGFPSYVQAKEVHNFQGRAHIYQGKFFFGADKSGLSDPFLRIIIGNQCLQTKVSQATLNPVWDQTLIIPRLLLYGTSDFIKSNPPLVIAEVFDKDLCNKAEFLGRCTFSPHIKLANHPYRPPDFPPKLVWHRVLRKQKTVGEILAAVELLEITGEDNMEIKAHDVVIRIPTDIKPNLVKYRLEVCFWGLRQLRKVNFVPVCKPKVVLECMYATLQTESAYAVRGCLNFRQPFQTLDVNLPEELYYIPPMCLKVFDCRSFGRFVLVGVQLVDMALFLTTLLTKVERERLLLQTPAPPNKRKPTQFLKTINFQGTQVTAHVNKGTSAKLQKGPRWKTPKFQHKKATTTTILNCFRKRQRSPDVERNQAKPSKKKRIAKVLYKILKGFFYAFCFVWKSKCRRKVPNCLKLRFGRSKTRSRSKPRARKRHVTDDNDNEDADWWTKYFASFEGVDVSKTRGNKLQVYENELEEQPEFKGFQDSLQVFQMHRDNLTGDDTVDEQNIKGILKASIHIYKHPPDDLQHYVTPTGHCLDKGVFQNFHSNDPLQFLLRVYCVKGINLRAKDYCGRSDPYIRVVLGNVTINDRANYIPRQVNPLFGRCFEMKGAFPQDHLLKVQVWDYDTISADDLIGETRIDIENRYYSKHRAGCGIPSDYHEGGYCLWRDSEKPTTILTNLCRGHNLPAPEYQANCVLIGSKQFHTTGKDGTLLGKETMALNVLRHWHEVPLIGFHLVPEHVETRSLYHYETPGIEQGKLQLWIDIFPFMDTQYPTAVNIAPRKPTSYELRVIIWNTEEVVLQEDDFFIGERMSDIYVKG
ncbi:otoferlin-like [Photinus pyralis]|uniref:otoferlin-like n=1 Tax=Photinus pyralis TaxID=7054 RepID=UPI00126725ED|nr:otoferlin-like [Photinus pyralis]